MVRNKNWIKKKYVVTNGRKHLDFDSGSETTKRQKTSKLREYFSKQDLLNAKMLRS